MFFKKLFYASAAVLMLALAYHLGASTATAQAPSNPVVAMEASGAQVMTANGDLYTSPDPVHGMSYTLVNNVFSGATPARQSSWGALKVQSR